MYQNLHSHTKTSDGELTHKQVLEVCKQNKISVVAFTDHDALPNEKTLKQLQALKSHPTKWIIGCEISSGWPKEIGGPTSNFHIVGLFVNPFDRALLEHCKKAQQSRIERMGKIVKNLRTLGFEISKEDCLRESYGETIGRPHIVSALKKKSKNLKIIEKLRKQMEKDSENDFKTKEKYDKMMTRGETEYPYSLFLKSGAFLPNIYVDYPYWKEMDESVKLIRNAGGIAILAHWTFSKYMIDIKMIEKFFKEKRLDGAEIVFGGDNVFNMNVELRNDMKSMEKLTKKCKVLQSGGMDSHKKEDFEFFVKDEELAKKTINLVEKMKELKDLNLKFSSL